MLQTHRVLTVIGNRPQFVKAAAVSGPLRAGARRGARPHRPALRRRAVDDLRRRARVPRPEHQLGLGGGTNTSRPRGCWRRSAADARRAARRACSSTATRTRRSPARSPARRRGVPVAHVEAGMRSFDRAMPEELNRVLTDHAPTLLLAPSRARRRETSRARASRATSRSSATSWSTSRSCSRRGARATTGARRGRRARPASYVLVTAHRAGNVDDPARLARLVDLLLAVPAPVVLPLHPRTRARLEAAGLLERLAAGVAAPAAARLPRVHGAAARRPRGADRLRWRAEGGVPRGRAVRDAARRRRSGSRRSTPAGTCSSTSTPTLRGRRSSGRRRPTRPALYGDGRAGERVVAALRTAIE